MNLIEILHTESENHRHIHLYRSCMGIWSCYGHSACLLNKLFPNIPYTLKDVSGTGETLPFMMIDPMTLADLLEKIPPVARDETTIHIVLPEEAAFLFR